MNRAEKHLRFGWCYLVLWVSIGLTLEALHGFKVGWYLDVGNDTRRLMFTLAHAHGSFLALVNIALALSAQSIWNGEIRASVSWSMIWAAILLPGGFLLGGIVIYGGDPGLGVWLVPVGALLLLYAVTRVAIDVSKKLSAIPPTPVIPTTIPQSPARSGKRRR